MAKYNQFLPVDINIKDVLNNTGKQLEIWGLTANEMDDIMARLTTGGGRFAKPKPDKNIKNIWPKGKALLITLENDKIDAFLDTGLKSIQSSLMHTRPNEANGILALTDEVASKCETISKDEMNKLFKDSEESEILMWQNYLNQIEDPKTRDMLILYSKIYGDTVYGHTLSLKNAMTIRQIDPNATFVLGKTSWAKYGRGIKRGAKRYPLWGWVPDKTKVSKADIDNAQKALGHDGADFKDLSVTVQDAIVKKASEGKGSMYRYIGYDISDTFQYGDVDLLQNKPGIIGNVAYTLNKLAQDLETQKGEHKNIEGYDEMVEKTKRAVVKVEDMCAANGMKPQVNKQMSPGSQLVDLLLTYYRPAVEKKSNILKPDNVKQFTEDAVQLTLLMNNIALDQLKRFKHSYLYTQKEAAALAPIIRSATYSIGLAINKNLSESILSETKDDFIRRFKEALKTLGIKIVREEDKYNTFDNATNDVNSVEDNTNSVEDANIMSDDKNKIETLKENFYRIFNKL